MIFGRRLWRAHPHKFIIQWRRIKCKECKWQHEQLCIIIKHKQKYRYKCTFNWKEMIVQAWRKKRMTSQREQYGDTVHLFIDTGHSPYKITFMPFTFDNNSIVVYRGLNSLFIFKSAPLFAVTPKLSCSTPSALYQASYYSGLLQCRL